jgi:hypothetical protein
MPERMELQILAAAVVVDLFNRVEPQMHMAATADQVL